MGKLFITVALYMLGEVPAEQLFIEIERKVVPGETDAPQLHRGSRYDRKIRDADSMRESAAQNDVDSRRPLQPAGAAHGGTADAFLPDQAKRIFSAHHGLHVPDQQAACRSTDDSEVALPKSIGQLEMYLWISDVMTSYPIRLPNVTGCRIPRSF
ncbi:hypothetical protein VQ056_12375 [Paenibacillus sp. JTLBN-2024]